MIKKIIMALLFVSVVGNANATTLIAGTAFDDDAFADNLAGSSGTFTVVGAGNLAAALTDISLDSYAYSFDAGAYVDLEFTDNDIVNGAGFDLALYDLGVPATFGVTINGITNSYLSSVLPGFFAGGYAVTASYINLDDFGIAANGLVNDIRVLMDSEAFGNPLPSLALAAAINSQPGVVPEPATMALLGMGFGLGGLMRRRKQAL